MGWFSKGDDIVDWRDPKIKRKISETSTIQPEVSQPIQQEATPFGFFGNFSSSNTTTSEDSEEERKRKLADRLLNLTNKLEDLSNQIYHLEQRLGVIEQKLNIGRDISSLREV